MFLVEYKRFSRLFKAQRIARYFATLLLGLSVGFHATSASAITPEEQEYVRSFLGILKRTMQNPDSTSQDALTYVEAGVLPEYLEWETIIALTATEGNITLSARKRHPSPYIAKFDHLRRHVSKIRPLDFGNAAELKCGQRLDALLKTLMYPSDEDETYYVDRCNFFDYVKLNFVDADAFKWLRGLDGFDPASSIGVAATERIVLLSPGLISSSDLRVLGALGYDFDRPFPTSILESYWSKNVYEGRDSLNFSEVITSKLCLQNSPECEDVCRLLNGEKSSLMPKVSENVLSSFVLSGGDYYSTVGYGGAGHQCETFLKSQVRDYPEVLKDIKRESLRTGNVAAIKYFEALATP